MNDPFSAAERHHLTEPEFGCRRCGRPVTAWDDLCGGCEDDEYEYAKDAAYEREERAAARGRECT